MRKFLFKSKKGVTILEGLIALGLLAVVSVGVFGVLLSVSRKSPETDIREEMLWAVERAQKGLQLYTVTYVQLDSTFPYPLGLCGGDNNPMNTDGTHDIACMLPAVCDRNNSTFTYKVSYVNEGTGNGGLLTKLTSQDREAPVPYDLAEQYSRYEVRFNITCNGFTL